MVPTHGNGFQLLLILLMPIKFLAIQNDNDFLFRCNENISEEKMWATAAEVVINLEEKSRSWTLINSWIHAFSMIENACSNLQSNGGEHIPNYNFFCTLAVSAIVIKCFFLHVYVNQFICLFLLDKWERCYQFIFTIWWLEILIRRKNCHYLY